MRYRRFIYRRFTYRMLHLPPLHLPPLHYRRFITAASTTIAQR
jgi:hypothetical protein